MELVQPNGHRRHLSGRTGLASRLSSVLGIDDNKLVVHIVAWHQRASAVHKPDTLKVLGPATCRPRG